MAQCQFVLKPNTLMVKKKRVTDRIRVRFTPKFTLFRNMLDFYI